MAGAKTAELWMVAQNANGFWAEDYEKHAENTYFTGENYKK